tara:strand:+ start:3498 stop:3734 length:237 start_codon:yes stop_codon:yes gene_type:complete
MTENIKNLYNGLKDKNGFLLAAAENFKYAPSTIKNHWVGGLMQIPEEKQFEFHSFTLNWARQENLKWGEEIEANAVIK